MHIEPRCIDHHISTVRLMHVEEFESILPMWSRIKKKEEDNLMEKFLGVYFIQLHFVQLAEN